MRGAIILAVALAACAQPPPAVPPGSVDNAAPLDAGPIVTTGHGSHLKLLVEPRDATIRITGSDPHVGVPYEVEEIEAGEYQTIRVVLEQTSP